MAIAFPQAKVEVWAMDEDRIGLKPLVRRIWAPVGKRLLAPVRHRFAWRYPRGVCPPGLRSHCLASRHGVSIPLFETELAAFAQAAGVGPKKEVVLVQDPRRVAYDSAPAGT